MSSKLKNGSRRSSIRIGNKVRFKLGARNVTALVVEDRGRIGRGGRRLLRVRMLDENADVASTFEIPQDDVALVR